MTYRMMLKTWERIGSLTDDELSKVEDGLSKVIGMCRSLDLPDNTVINVWPLARLSGETVCRMTYGDASFVYFAIQDESEARIHMANEGITWCRLDCSANVDDEEDE